MPSLLPQERPTNFPSEWINGPDAKEVFQFGRIYQFDFEFEFGRILLRLLQMQSIQAVMFWKHGALFQSTKNSESFFMEWKPHNNCLNLKVRIRKPDYDGKKLILLRYIVEMIETILEGFYPGHGEVKRMIPCCHCYQQKTSDVQGPYHFNYEYLAKQVLKGHFFVNCRGVPSRKVSVQHLAPDIAFNDFPIILPDAVQIDRQIGCGGYGVVYRGKYGSLDVAIKELKPGDDDDDGRIDDVEESKKFSEFQREVYMMSRLNHPNLVELYGVQVQPRLRMIMEWCDMGDLYHHLRTQGEMRKEGSQPLSIDWHFRFRVCLDIAKGMRYLQNVTPPIIHRDLRSPNVFLVSTDPKADVVAKVADFGLSRRADGMLRGILPTWQWLAPEIIDAESLYYDESSDIYSFAIVVWEIMLGTGEAPYFEFESEMKTMNIKQGICKKGLRPTIPSDTPLVIREMMKRCWDHDPSSRLSFDDCVQILSELLDLPIDNGWRDSQCISFASNLPINNISSVIKTSTAGDPTQSDAFDEKEYDNTEYDEDGMITGFSLSSTLSTDGPHALPIPPSCSSSGFFLYLGETEPPSISSSLSSSFPMTEIAPDSPITPLIQNDRTLTSDHSPSPSPSSHRLPLKGLSVLSSRFHNLHSSQSVPSLSLSPRNFSGSNLYAAPSPTSPGSGSQSSLPLPLSFSDSSIPYSFDSRSISWKKSFRIPKTPTSIVIHEMEIDQPHTAIYSILVVRNHIWAGHADGIVSIWNVAVGISFTIFLFTFLLEILTSDLFIRCRRSFRASKLQKRGYRLFCMRMTQFGVFQSPSMPSIQRFSVFLSNCFLFQDTDFPQKKDDESAQEL